MIKRLTANRIYFLRDRYYSRIKITQQREALILCKIVWGANLFLYFPDQMHLDFGSKQSKFSYTTHQKTMSSKFLSSFRKAHWKNSAPCFVHFGTHCCSYTVIDHLEIDRTYIRLLFLVPVLTGELERNKALLISGRIWQRQVSLSLLSFILIELWQRPDVIPMLKLHCFHNKVSLHHS